MPLWTVPVALLFIITLSFGTLIPWLGFYWDDWPSIWHFHLLGPSGFKDVFAIDRPLLGRIFMLTTPLLGESAAAWQIFGLLTRWSSCLACWWLLHLLWPAHSKEITWAVFLFAVYPGFQQQFISVTYSHAWIILTAFLASLGLMVYAIRRSKWFWPATLSSWFLAAFSLFSTEYFFGLELLRPVFLWMVLGEQFSGLSRPGKTGASPEWSKRITRILRLWLPYLAITAIFLVWRLFLHDTPRGQVQFFDQLLAQPGMGLLALMKRVITDVFNTSFGAWGQIFKISDLLAEGRLVALAAIAIALLVAGLVAFYLAKLQISPAAIYPSDRSHSGQTGVASPVSPKHWAWQTISISTLALFLGGIPFWMTDLPIRLEFPWDRFTLAMMLGASLLLAGLLVLIAGTRLPGVLVLALMIGLAAGQHFQEANLFRREWMLQKSFFWQLTWRAPGIETGTTVLTASLPFKYYSDNSLTAPLNWLYAPENQTRQMSYLFYSVEARLGSELAGLAQGFPINAPYRATSFQGSTSQILGVYYAPPGCLKVLDPTVHDPIPQKPPYLGEVILLSDPRLVLVNKVSPVRPPSHIFGAEPEPNWCYYYQKAELASQIGDWHQVAALGEQALKLGELLYPVNAPELIPYIEGYAHLGQWERAEQLSSEAQRLTFRMKHMLCATWERIERETPKTEEQQAATTKAKTKYNCAPP